MDEDQAPTHLADSARLTPTAVVNPTDTNPVIPTEAHVRQHASAVEGPASSAPEGRCAPEVTIRAAEEGDLVVIAIDDNGPGLANPDNLFVPLYTTKKSGTGVGLALARQIVEAHGGSIDLRNRQGTQGCRAEVRLPIAERTRT
jgi:signal transduction histidine kinase